MISENQLKLFTRSFNLSDKEFYSFCQDNSEINIERDAQKNIIIMSPTKLKTSVWNAVLIGQLYTWNEKEKNGYVGDSNGAFHFKNGAIRSPDAAWISKENNFDFNNEIEEFEKVCPDFVIELKSKSDSIKTLKEKMEEYISNGVKLAYLIIPEQENVLVYQPNKAVIERSFSEKIIAESVVTGFELDLSYMKK